MAKGDVFACRITKATGENEATEVSFQAADKGELKTRLAQAADVIQDRVKEHNQKVLKVSDDVRARVREASDEIKHKHQQDLLAQGWSPPAKEANGADAASGPADVRPDP